MRIYIVLFLVFLASDVLASENIISFNLVRSYPGTVEVTETAPNEWVITSRKRLEIGMMYQRQVGDNLYMGGSFDRNNGMSLSLGWGW